MSPASQDPSGSPVEPSGNSAASPLVLPEPQPTGPAVLFCPRDSSRLYEDEKGYYCVACGHRIEKSPAPAVVQSAAPPPALPVVVAAEPPSPSKAGAGDPGAAASTPEVPARKTSPATERSLAQLLSVPRSPSPAARPAATTWAREASSGQATVPGPGLPEARSGKRLLPAVAVGLLAVVAMAAIVALLGPDKPRASGSPSGSSDAKASRPERPSDSPETGRLIVRTSPPAKASLGSWQAPDGGTGKGSVHVWSGLEAGTYQLQVFLEGFETHIEPLTVQAGRNTEVQVTLRSKRMGD